jgi:hypothetical protein
MIPISFIHQKLSALQAAYDKAIKEGKTEFPFEGNDLGVGYAKFLIQHLKNTLEVK